MEVGERFRAIAVCDSPTQRALNVFHFVVTSKVGTGGTLTQAITALEALMAVRYKVVLAPEATWRGMYGQKYFPIPPELPVAVTTNAGVGTATGQILPGQLCGILSWRTAKAGRKYRGRSYIPFPAEGSNIPNGEPEAGYVNAIRSIGDDLLAFTSFGAGGNTNGCALILQGRQQLADMEPIILRVGRSYWGVQRRRGTPTGPDAVGATLP